MIGQFWSASAAFGAITRAVNRALGAKRPHPFFLSKLRYLLMTLAVSLLVILSVAITAALEILPRLRWRVRPPEPPEREPAAQPEVGE